MLLFQLCQCFWLQTSVFNIHLWNNGCTRFGKWKDDTFDWSPMVPVAMECLQKNKIIALPTDTIYGIAGLAQSSTALKKIYSIKGRDTRKPISIGVGHIDDIYKWANVNVSNELLCELLPGPVTVVFERTLALNPDLNPSTNLVGIRIPNHGFIQQICEICAEPLALTSANVSNGQSTLSANEFEYLWSKLDIVFDGGRLGETDDWRSGSTVVDLSQTGVYTVIRKGSAFQETRTILENHDLQDSSSNL